MMADLDGDMVEEILRKLPVKSLVRFKCVCKGWGERFRNPNFIEAHHRTQTAINNAKFMPSKFLLRRMQGDGSVFFTSLELRIDEEENVTLKEKENIFFPFLSQRSSCVYEPKLDEAHVCGPCNGIMCLSRGSEIALWNPATREVKFLPRSTVMPPAGSYLRFSEVMAFGYDSKIDDYKVLRTVCDELWEDEVYIPVRSILRLELYSWRKNEWKLLRDKYPCAQDSPNLCIDGVCHIYQHRTSMLSFDLVDEVFTSTDFPRCNYTLEKMVCVDDCLGLVTYIANDGLFEIWILKETGVEGSWIRHRILGPVDNVLQVHAFWKNKILVEIYKEGDNKEQIAVYDPEIGSLQALPFSVTHDDERREFFNYVESLAPINGRYEHEEGIMKQVLNPFGLFDASYSML